MIITGGYYKGRKIKAPNEKITRPTLSKIRQSVFNTLYSLIGDFEGKSFLDLFGGSGIMGIEAISRGFDKVCVFEKNPKVAQISKENYLTLGLKPDLKIGDSLKLLAKENESFDVIYIDPPYYSGIYEEVFNLINNVIHSETIIIAEHFEPLDISKFSLINEKKYGGKIVSYYKYSQSQDSCTNSFLG